MGGKPDQNTEGVFSLQMLCSADEALGHRPQKATADLASKGQLLHRNVQRFRGGLVFKAHRLCVSLNSRLESDKEEDEADLSPKGLRAVLIQGLGTCWSHWLGIGAIGLVD